MDEHQKIMVLYGSQTGNAESIAQDLVTTLQDEHHRKDVECKSLNEIKDSVKSCSLKDSDVLMIIICSTTGNGDAPENCDGWWRVTKLRSCPKDTLQGVKYCTLALGDTNYDKFCHMGRSIDKRLGELGGVRILDLFCADEATNMEEVVEDWKKKIIAAVVAGQVVE